jgi:formate--tetrahydrofolate ligase
VEARRSPAHCRLRSLRPATRQADVLRLGVQLRVAPAGVGSLREDPAQLEQRVEGIDAGCLVSIRISSRSREACISFMTRVSRSRTAAERGRDRQRLPRRLRPQAGPPAQARARARRGGRRSTTASSAAARGAAMLAETVTEAARHPSAFEPVYELDLPIAEKIEAVATRVYGADGVELLPAARKAAERYEKLDLGHLPVCRRRRTSRSRTTRGCATRRPVSPCPCATSVPTLAPAGSSRSAARCRRCRASASIRRRSRSTSCRTAGLSGSSRRDGRLGPPAPPRHLGRVLAMLACVGARAPQPRVIHLLPQVARTVGKPGG